VKLVFDIETNGLLKQLDRIHCLVIRDVEPDDFNARTTWRFRNNAEENNIEEGIRLLTEADAIIGHNIIGFDIPAIKKIYPDFDPPDYQVIDTLVLSRIIRANQKEQDFALAKKGALPGKLIGSHSLDAWGHRLGLNKGDYSIEMMKKGLDPWASWNVEMEDYCENDIDVNEVLWEALKVEMTTDKANRLEHDIHKLATEISSNGIPFDLAAAEALKSKLEANLEVLEGVVKDEFGSWYKPKRWKVVKDPYPIFSEEREKVEAQIDRYNAQKFYYAGRLDKLQARVERGIPGAKAEMDKNSSTLQEKVERCSTVLKKLYDNLKGLSKVNGRPMQEWGEDFTRTMWGECVFPKRTMKNKKFGDRAEGCPYTPVERVDFNPGSRTQIIDRFVQCYGWQPEEFTDKGNPKVDDAVLNKLEYPMAKPLAEILFHKKLLGQLSNGPGSWLNNYDEDTGAIHHYINTGGTVTGRCSHNSPNLGQVPGVVINDGEIIRGRAGDYGYECRTLFHTPAEGYYTEDGKVVKWVQIGADLANIEFRMLAEVCEPFDDGELISVIETGRDVHAYNMEKTKIDNRGLMKRVLFGLLYGAGDWKLGHTFDPALNDDQKREKGRELRNLVADGLPALAKAIQKAQQDAQSGHLIGLDGRQLFCRSPHSALNLRLQSAAALVAKRWAVSTAQEMKERGYVHDWFGDFAMLAFVHDEIQTAVREDAAAVYETIVLEAATRAGEFFGLKCPISAEAKVGQNWAECH